MSDRKWPVEFVLVLAMLVSLTVLIFIVLYSPAPPVSTDNPARDIFEYRGSILAIIVTAFGAWIGAGAAYYFGRENLRQATRSMLDMREVSPRERLRKPIRDIPPRSLDWIVKTDDTLGTVLAKLEQAPALWFVPVVKDGALETVIKEDAAYWYVIKSTRDGQSHADVEGTTVQQMLDSLEARGLGKFKRSYATVGMDTSTIEANDLMEQKEVSLAIVMDSEGRPTHYITTADVRRVMLGTA